MRADTEYLTTRELAQRWKLSEWTICDYARRGLIAGATRAGRGYRFSIGATLRPVAEDSGPATVKERGTSFERFTRELDDLGGR